MERLVLSLVGCLVLLPGAVSAPVPADDRMPPSISLPLKVGTKWVYKIPSPAGGDEEEEEVEVVTECTSAGGIAWFTTASNPKEKTYVDKYVLDKSGLCRTMSNGSEAKPPLPRLKFPLAVGAKWNWAYDEGRGLSGTDRVVGVEWVTVPAGRFRCVRIESVRAYDSGHVKVDVWYAPDVGLVKVWGGGYKKELKSLTVPK